MLTYNMDERGRLPLYEYLYQCIREDIMAGVIKPGEKLPSKRELARDLDIAIITVENAYAQLLTEGYIISREKSGYYVEKLPTIAGLGSDAAYISMKHQKDEPIDLSKKLSKNLSKSSSEPLSDEKIKKAEEIPVWANFTANHSSRESFPYATWSKLMRRVLADCENDFTGRPASEGVYELRLAIAHYLGKARGLRVNPEQIIIGPGTEYLHGILIQLIGRTRIVAVEDPGYTKVGQIYEGNGMKVLHLPVDREGLLTDLLYGSNARLVHCSPSHHFPTGCVMSARRRHQILDWAKSQEGYIVEDDYDSEFRFQGRPVPTLASLSDECVIYMNTFTKTLAPSIRIAYMVLPVKLSELYRKKLSYYSGSVSTFEQLTLARFISEGYYERHINRMRNQYRKAREDILEIWKSSNLSAKTQILEDQSGLHFILKCKSAPETEASEKQNLEKQHLEEQHLEEQHLEEQHSVEQHTEKMAPKTEEQYDDLHSILLKKGILLAPVTDYCVSTQQRYKGMYVLNYTTALGREQVEKAFRIMSECM